MRVPPFWIVIIHTLLWILAVICLLLMILQYQVFFTTFWETIAIPPSAMGSGARSGELVYKVPLEALGLNQSEARMTEMRVLEDGVPLARPNSNRRNAAKQGMGRYLVWQNTLHFSSSDNESPLENGRLYQMRLPASISLKWVAGLSIFIAVYTLWLLYNVPPFRRFLGILLINLFMLSALTIGFEAFLKSREPRQPGSNEKYPYDSNYAQINPNYYDDQNIPYAIKTKEYTWGVFVEKNRHGYRERNFEEPKPEGICRIMALGDSLTWGVGLEVEDRYTNLLETKLKAEFPEREFEVLNFGLRGGPTIEERDILRTHMGSVTPDWVMIGFCTNDPQPKSANYWQEKEEFYARVMPYLMPVFNKIDQAGFPEIAWTTRSALDHFLTYSGLIPGSGQGLMRTYDPESVEWKEFYQALVDIRDMSTDAGLPAPLFVALNQTVEARGNGNYLDNSPDLPQTLRMTRQAERAAAEIGYYHTNMEKELLEKVKPEEMKINPMDGHPSGLANRVYAEKLFEMTADLIRRGVVCPP